MKRSKVISIRITITHMKDGIASVSLPGTRAVSGSVSVEFHVCGLKRYLVIQARAQEMIAQHGSFRSRNLINEMTKRMEQVVRLKGFSHIFRPIEYHSPDTLDVHVSTFIIEFQSVKNFLRGQGMDSIRQLSTADNRGALKFSHVYNLIKSEMCFHQSWKLLKNGYEFKDRVVQPAMRGTTKSELWTLQALFNRTYHRIDYV